MAKEKFWLLVGATQMTAAGSLRGRITVISTFGFKVKMKVALQYLENPSELYEVKQVLSETQMELGPIKSNINDRSDLTGFAIGTRVFSMAEARNSIPLQDIGRSTYEEEPTVAQRIIPVDEFGNLRTDENPFPINGRELSVLANVQTLSLMISQMDTPSVFETDTLVRVGDELVSIGSGKLVRSA